MKLRHGSVFVALAVVVLAVTGCPGQTLFPTCDDPAHPCAPYDPNYPEDAIADGNGSPNGRACRALRAAGCAEGFKDPRTAKTCYQRIESEGQLAKIPAECVAGSKTPDAVRACGTKDTIRFRCRMPAVGDGPDGG